MNYEFYYNICDFAQKVYDRDPTFLPTNNITPDCRNKIRRYNVVDDRFNALFYYEYIMFLIGISSTCLKLKKN